MITVPNSFKLGGRTWSVELVDMIDDDSTLLGDCDGSDAVIRLKSGLKAETFQHTFYHELCHAICFTLGWGKLNEDEERVDALASALFQYLKTKRGTTTNP